MCRKKLGGFLDSKLIMSQQSVLAAKARSTVGCMRREALPSGGGRWSLPSTLHCWNTCWVQFSALQQERDMYILEQVSEGLVKSWRVWSRRRLGPLELLPTFGTVTLCWGGINLLGHNTGNALTLMVFPAPLLSFFLILLIFLQLRSYWLKLQKLIERGEKYLNRDAPCPFLSIASKEQKISDSVLWD